MLFSGRTLVLLLSAALLFAASRAHAGPQKDSVCQGSCGGGCGPCSGEDGGGGGRSAFDNTRMGGFTKMYMDATKACPTFGCAISQFIIGMPIGLMLDAPYYAVKGVGYGLFYGGKGLGYGAYYAAVGVGKGAVAVGHGAAVAGAAIGHAVAAPFRSRPKPTPADAPALASLGSDTPREHFELSHSIEDLAISPEIPPALNDEINVKLDKIKFGTRLPTGQELIDGALFVDMHREGLAKISQLTGSAEMLNGAMGNAFLAVGVLDAGITLRDGNVAGAAGKLAAIGLGVLEAGPAWAIQILSATTKSSLLALNSGIYQATTNMTASEANELAQREYDEAHAAEKSKDARFFLGFTGL